MRETTLLRDCVFFTFDVNDRVIECISARVRLADIPIMFLSDETKSERKQKYETYNRFF